MISSSRPISYLPGPNCELNPQDMYLCESACELISGSDYTDQSWTWINDGITFYFDVGEIVRFRVETESWHDQIPNAPDQPELLSERKPPYSIIVSLRLFFTAFLVFSLVRVISPFWRRGETLLTSYAGRVRCRWLAWGPLRGGYKARLNPEGRKHEDRCGEDLSTALF